MTLDRQSRRSFTRASSATRSGSRVRDYEGGMSTLCAGCGHDSITAAIVQAFFELDIAPHASRR